jgi:predicted dehydrogenase
VPLADTLEDCIKVKETVEKTGLKYMLFESSYYRQPCIAARELYQAGAFGRLAYSEVEYYHPGIGGRVNTATRWMGLKNWRYGLPPMLYSHHALGLAVGVTGERITKVSCLGQRIGDDFPTEHENPYHNPSTMKWRLGSRTRGISAVLEGSGAWRRRASGVTGWAKKCHATCLALVGNPRQW